MEPFSLGSARRTGNVDEPELDLFAPLIVVERQAPREMQRLISVAHQHIAERGSGSAEGDGLEAGAIVRGQGEADMPALPHDLRKTGAMGGKDEDRRGIAGAEGTGLFEAVQQVDGSAASGERGIDPQSRGSAGGSNAVPEPVSQKGAQGAEIAGPKADAGRHGMAAAPRDQSRLDRRDDGAAQIDTRHGAPRAGAGAIGMEGDGEAGTAEAFAQARRDEPHYSGMPIGRGQYQYRRPLPGPDLRGSSGRRFLDGLHLDALALAIELVEPGSENHGLMLIIQ